MNRFRRRFFVVGIVVCTIAVTVATVFGGLDADDPTAVGYLSSMGRGRPAAPIEGAKP